ncbi:MAG: NADP-dependent oxidoreductase [Myxococcota bacterium]
MKKIQYSRYGGPEELRLDEVAPPSPRQNQVRIQVKAASVNPMDWKIRRGEMKALSGFRFPRGLGHDFAGVVDAVGPGVSHFKPGDEVIGVTSVPHAGAMADAVVADAKNIWLKPPSVPFVEAAALTIVGLTAWTALVERAKLSAGQAVFVNGCLGAVGRSAVQLARLYGASVVGSCSATRCEEARALGVGEVVDHRALDIHSFERCFDVVFDTVGTLSLHQSGVMLKRGGLSLHIVPTFAKWIGSVFSPRHHLVFGNPTPQSLAGITEAAERGILVPAIGRVVPLSEAIAAIAELERTGLPKGKLVIVPG